jgi:glycosyltransferase involved in cell wall biosynthesis
MLRIFYVIDSFDLGGAQRQLLELVRHLDPHEFHLAVCTIWPLKNLEPDYLQTGVEVIQIHKRHRYDFLFAFRLAQEMRHFKPDIVHTWLFTGNLWGRLAAILANAPIIVIGERNFLPDQKYPFYFWPFNKILDLWTDRITVNCKFGMDIFLDRGFKKAKLCLIHNGVDTEHFSWNENTQSIRTTRREKLGIAENIPVVSMVGRLTEQKRQDVLLKAIKLVVESGTDVRCLLIGDGEDREKLTALSASLNITGKVLFLGKRMDIPELLRASDIFALSSNWEGMPNVILEAMASELPVIATNVPGTAEAVINGITGFLVSKGDSAALAERLLILIRDPGLGKRMGKNGRDFCEKEFSIEKMLKNTNALYSELIEIKRSASA